MFRSDATYMGLTISLKKQPGDKDDELVLFPEAEHLQPLGQDRGADWFGGEEGQLAVDVYDGEDEIVIRSPIAGVRPEDLEVFVHNDMLTVRGQRMTEEEVKGRRVVHECHWGSFSRSIILPAEIDAERISAELKNGVLTVRLPKAERKKKIDVREA